MYKAGFDREKYLTLQGERIGARRRQFGGKFYLEFGGELADDIRASRVLPGFTPDNKIVMLADLADEVETVVVIDVQDLFRHKVRADLGTSYGNDVLRHIDAFRSCGLYAGSMVISHRSDNNHQAIVFKRGLERLGIEVYRHYVIPGYLHNVARIASPEGHRRNEYIETEHDLVVVTVPDSGSGRMTTRLSQLYHDRQQDIRSGHVKFEAFSIWNLPLDRPVNIAYEAATADLNDADTIDHFHLTAYGEQTVNYDRDIEIFPILKRLFGQLLDESSYQSPTDMGVNMAGICIGDDKVCRKTSRQEVIRRYFKALTTEHRDQSESIQLDQIALLMNKLQISREDHPVVLPALGKQKATKGSTATIQLSDDQIIVGKTSPLLGACSAMLLDTLKILAGIDPDMKLPATETIEPIQTLKTKCLGSRNPRLHTDGVLIALSVSTTYNDFVHHALAELHDIRDCDVHLTVIPGSVDEAILRSLGAYVTCEPVFQAERLYRKH